MISLLYLIGLNNGDYMQDNQREALLKYAYIAGIIDGEGSIMITRSCSGYKRKTPSYTPRVKVGMTERHCLDFIVEHTGIGTVTDEGVRKSHRDGCNRKGFFQWQVHSLTNVPKFLEMIAPFLVLKRPQAELILMYCACFDKQKKCMDGVPDDVRAFREETYNKMRKLNGRKAPATTKPRSNREVEAIV